MKRKDQGFVEKLLPVLLSTGMVFGLVLLSGRFSEMLRNRERINQIARAYLLEMETLGYLPNDQKFQLQETLEACGLTDISFGGTTLSEAEYGDIIYLMISGTLEVDLQVSIPFVEKNDIAWDIPLQLRMVSTAKH
jgi:hypothetical protein